MACCRVIVILLLEENEPVQSAFEHEKKHLNVEAMRPIYLANYHSTNCDVYAATLMLNDFVGAVTRTLLHPDRSPPPEEIVRSFVAVTEVSSLLRFLNLYFGILC